MKYAAIPTVYKGVQMRSRLEARWAAFFDLMGYDWQYEPIDLDGWIPDFSVRIKREKKFPADDIRPYLMEVKPLSDAKIPSSLESEILRGLGIQSVLDRQPEGRPGFPPLPGETPSEHYTWARQLEDACQGLPYRIGVLGINPGVMNEWHRYWLGYIWDLACCRFEKRQLTDEGQIEKQRADTAWIEAGNAVQWKSPRRAA